MVRWKLDATVPAGDTVKRSAKVTLSGLSNAALNGKAGVVATPLDPGTGRCGVRLSAAGKDVAVRPINLLVAHRTVAACTLATHVGSLQRVEALRHCIQSIQAQSQSPALYLSWSAASPDIAKRVKGMLATEGLNSGSHSCGGGCFYQEEKRSQFQHYEILAHRIKADEAATAERDGVSITTWVLFSDDDDVWHPNRLEFYCLLLGQISDEQRATSQALTCAWYAMRNDKDGKTAPSEASPVTSAQEVDSLLQRGAYFVHSVDNKAARVRMRRPPLSPASSTSVSSRAFHPSAPNCSWLNLLLNPNAASNPCLSAAQGVEYWTSMLRLERLLEFFAIAPAGLVASAFCDVAFAQWFAKGHGEDVSSINVSHNPQVRSAD